MLVVGLLLLVTLSLAFPCGVALGTCARRADEALDEELELIPLATRLARLAEECSPGGRRFFPTPAARLELAEAMRELLGATPPR